MVKIACLFFLGLTGASLQSMESALVNIKNNALWTPLHTAVLASNVEAVKELLARGAQVDAQEACKRTPLMFGAAHNKEKIARLLLKNGASVDLVDCDGMSAIDIACKQGSLDVIEPLVMADTIVTEDALRYALS